MAHEPVVLRLKASGCVSLYHTLNLIHHESYLHAQLPNDDKIVRNNDWQMSCSHPCQERYVKQSDTKPFASLAQCRNSTRNDICASMAKNLSDQRTLRPIAQSTDLVQLRRRCPLRHVLVACKALRRADSLLNSGSEELR